MFGDMKKMIQRVGMRSGGVGILLGAFIIATFLSLSYNAHAFSSIWPTYSCGSTPGSATCSASKSTSDPITGPNGVIIRVADLFALAAGIVAVIVIILAGWSYISSGGDAAKTKTAKDTIIYALVGIVVIWLAHSVLTYVVNNVG